MYCGAAAFDAFADGVFVRIEAAREVFVHDGYGVRPLGVGVVEVPALEQGDAHRLKILGEAQRISISTWGSFGPTEEFSPVIVPELLPGAIGMRDTAPAAATPGKARRRSNTCRKNAARSPIADAW